MTTLIGTAFVIDRPGEESFFPQVSGKSSSPGFQAVYWRAIAVLFASSAKHNPTARHVLFCNAPPPDTRHLPIGDILRRYRVETVLLPFTYRAAAGVTASFGNVLYIFDVIKHVGKEIDADRILILDPDCVCLRPAAALLDLVDAHGAAFYDIGYSPHQDNNGLTRTQLGEMLPAFGAAHPHDPPALPPAFVGGELYAVTAAENRRIAGLIDPVLARNDALRAEGRPHLVTEEHFFSLAASLGGYDTSLAGAHIKRIWTAFRYRNTGLGDSKLSIWHLPAEKRTGLAALFRELRSEGTRFWATAPGDDFARYVGRYCGIPEPSARKLISDAVDRLAARLGIF